MGSIEETKEGLTPQRKFRQFQPVWDSSCGELGVVLGYAGALAAVAYVRDWGCTSNIDTADEDILEETDGALSHIHINGEGFSIDVSWDASGKGFTIRTYEG